MVGLLLSLGYMVVILYRVMLFEARSVSQLGERLSSRFVNGEMVERVLGAPFLLSSLVLMLSAYATWKPNVLQMYAMPLDESLATIDRFLHFGDPWRWTHALFDGWTPLLDELYGRWYSILLGAVLVASIARPVVERARFFWAVGLLYVVGGTLLAMLLSSGGPAYALRLTGNTEFVPLTNEVLGTTARLLQLRLWNAHIDPSYTMIFGGISAMPSLHVGIAVLLAHWGFGIHRIVGISAVAYAVLIMIGSVHLGWHYAIDGYVGAALASGCWFVAGRIVGVSFAQSSLPTANGRIESSPE